VDVSIGTVLPGTFETQRWGWRGSGTGWWDDYALEMVQCNGLPSEADRLQLRNYLNNKWGIF